MNSRQPRLTAAATIVAIGVCGMFGWPLPASEQAGWEVTDLDSGASSFPKIAVDEGGNAIAVWDNGQRIRTATFAAATETWSQPVTLSNPVDFTFDHRVASNAAGDAIAVWSGTRSSNGTTYIALSRYSAATKTWDNALELPTKGSQTRAVIDGQGNITVVWAEFLRVTPGYYYDEEVHELRSVRYDAATATWSSPVVLSGEYAWQPEVAIDGAGNVTLVWWSWSDGFIESVRWSSGTGRWSDIRRLSSSSAYFPAIVVDTRGDVTAVWHQSTPSNPRALHAARYSADTGTWSPPVFVAAPSDPETSLGVDATGNVTVVYASTPYPYGFPQPDPATLRSISYLRASNSWSVPEDIATNAGFGGGQIAVDPYGNATVTWLTLDRTLWTARRPIGGQWSTDATVAGAFSTPRIASDVVGNIFLLWSRRAPGPAVQAARWSASLAAPTIGRVTSRSGALTIDFTPPRVLTSAHAVLNYEYSVNDGATWTPRTPASGASPMLVEGLTNGVAYRLRLRGINIAGTGLASDALTATPGLEAPENLRATVVGNAVTLIWTPPSSGVLPTGYLLEGGITPGTTLAGLRSPGTATTVTFAPPQGVFYVRARATVDQAESEPSNEVTINVGVPGPPSPPKDLLGLADGDALTLAWQNTVAGGAPSEIFLDVTGDRLESIQLPLTERFSHSGVPAGTYTFAVRASNESGISGPSNAVTLTFPGTCSPPATPTNFTASKIGNTIFVSWSPPASGTAPTRYLLIVSGSIEGSLPVTGLALSGAVGQGTYIIGVAAENTCGTSPATPPKTITIP